MARNSPYRPFTPHPDQAGLTPQVSGNTVNGLGEKVPRRADYVYWHDDPDQIPHGELQRWFYTQHADDPDIERAREARAKVLAEPLPDVAAHRAPGNAHHWSEQLQKLRGELDCELLGVATMRPDWVYEGHEIAHRYVVMIGVAHEYDAMRHAPKLRAGAEVIRQYGRGAKAAKAVTAWIRRQGYPAEPHSGPMAGKLLMIPAAIACGFGELGRHGSIIHRELGSSFRLAAVTTDMPLEPTEPEEYGVDDFCSRCQVCTNACPPDAILPEKKWVRGELKWYVDFDRCLPFFNEHFGCGICIAVCPWSLPGRGPRIVEQLRRRRERV